MNRPDPAQLRRAVDAFNARHKVGDAFWAYTGLKGENPIACTLRAPAELLGGHTPVAWLDGVSGCIALTHLEPRQVEDGHCDICDQPIKGPDLCATDVDMGPCHAACLEGSPIVSRETGEVLPDAKPSTYRWDSLPITP
ncbi:MAG: hypothetical protein LCH57_01745 [Proteobacteria bacterium]|nr:hypothetical protein [Pseudomonadota bacterium]